MKHLLALAAIALLLAGCTTPDEAGDGTASEDNGTRTGADRGGEVSTKIEVVENESSTTSGNETAANTSTSG